MSLFYEIKYIEVKTYLKICIRFMYYVVNIRLIYKWKLVWQISPFTRMTLYFMSVCNKLIY